MEENSNSESWSIVTKKGKQDLIQKINQPCWFFNTGGCKNKDGSDKQESECKYLHILTPTIVRPSHINPTKPCDKYNLEGYCKFGDYCKYSHRNLTQQEWNDTYPNIPFGLRLNNQKREYLEIKIRDVESRLNILEYKLKSMDEHYEKNFKHIYNMLQDLQED